MAVKLTGQRLTTIDANGNRFVKVGTGTNDTDGVNLGQVKPIIAAILTTGTDTLVVPVGRFASITIGGVTTVYYNGTAADITFTGPTADLAALKVLLDASNLTDVTSTASADVMELEAQIPATNVWQASLRDRYVEAQKLTDFTITRIVTETLTGNGAVNRQFLLTYTPTTELTTDIFLVASPAVGTITIEDVVNDTITLSGVIGVGNTFQVTYITAEPEATPTLNPTTEIENGISRREYFRTRPDAATDVLPIVRPRDVLFADYTRNLEGRYLSQYWEAITIDGEEWRAQQEYFPGDVVSYIDINGIPRYAYSGTHHISSASTNPAVFSALVFQPAAFTNARPWEVMGSAIDISSGSVQDADAFEFIDEPGTATEMRYPVVIQGLLTGTGARLGQWGFQVGILNGTNVEVVAPSTAALAPADQIPITINVGNGDIISFGLTTGTEPTTAEFEISDVVREDAAGDPTITMVYFTGAIPAEVNTLFAGGNRVAIYQAGARADLGQANRFIFASEDFAVNTDDQSIGHAHISVVGKQDTLPNLNQGRVWTNVGTGANPDIRQSAILSVGYVRREDASITYDTRTAFENDGGRAFDDDAYIYIEDYDPGTAGDQPAMFEVTTAGTGFGGYGTRPDGETTAYFIQRTLDAIKLENVVLESASDVAREGHRWLTTESWQENRLSTKQDNLQTLGYAGIWTNAGTAANPVYISEDIDIVGILSDQHANHTFTTEVLFEADTTTDFEIGQYVTTDDEPTKIWKVTTAGRGWANAVFMELAIDDEDEENLIIATASAVARAHGRFPTTEAWQNNRFATRLEVTKATYDSAQFVATVTSTDAGAVSLIHKRIITGNNVVAQNLYGEIGADALTIYANQDRSTTLLVQNYTG